MLVDDHEVVRLGLGSLLTRTDNMEIVAEAGSVKEAVEEAARHHPDVVLMDLRLPDGSGLDACREILAARPALGVVSDLLLGRRAVVSTILAGAAGYLLKEIGTKALINAIELVYGGNPYWTQKSPAVMVACWIRWAATGAKQLSQAVVPKRAAFWSW